MRVRKLIATTIIAGIVSSSADASTITNELIKLNLDESSLNPWATKNESDSKDLLCIDQVEGVREAIRILNQKEICKVSPKIDNFSESGIKSMEEVISRTIRSSAAQAEFRSVESSRYLVSSSFATAFLPKLEISDALIKTSKSIEKSSSQSSLYNPKNGDLLSDGAWTFTETTTLDNPEYEATFALKIPVYKPYDIQYYAYYKSIGKAGAFSSTSSIDSEVKTSLQEIISLWISYKQINMDKLNVIAAIESLESTIGQYKIGALAIPDIAQSLSTLRSYQSALASEYETYLTSYNSLASQLDLKPSDLSLSREFLKVSFLNPLLNYSAEFNSKTLQASVTNSNSVYNYLYLSSSYLDLGKSYLAEYLPAISLSLGYSYITNNESINTDKCTGSWNCNLYSSERQFISNNDPSVALSFSWTLFDSGAAYYEYRSQKKTAESNFDNAVNAAYEAIESITTDFQKQRLINDEIEFNYSSLASSNISYNETLLAYKAGFSDTTSLVQRLTNLVSARSTFLSSIQNQLTNKLHIMHSLRNGLYEDLNYFELDYNQDLTEKLNVIND